MPLGLLSAAPAEGSKSGRARMPKAYQSGSGRTRGTRLRRPFLARTDRVPAAASPVRSLTVGIDYAATDVEARWCRDTDAVVIGGGNSAGQAAMFLSRTAKHVHLFVRGDSLAASMSDYLSSRLDADPAITIHYGTEMTALHGDDHLEGIDALDRTSGERRRVDTRAVFVRSGPPPTPSGPAVASSSTTRASCGAVDASARYGVVPPFTFRVTVPPSRGHRGS